MDNLKNNVWEDPEIIEIRDDLFQEKIESNFAYATIRSSCTSCY